MCQTLAIIFYNTRLISILLVLDCRYKMAPPQEIIKGEALERYQRYATEDYPELDKDAALEKYIRKEKRQGIFFIDSLGNRCVFGPGRFTIMRTSPPFLT